MISVSRKYNFKWRSRLKHIHAYLRQAMGNIAPSKSSYLKIQGTYKNTIYPTPRRVQKTNSSGPMGLRPGKRGPSLLLEDNVKGFSHGTPDPGRK